MIVYEVHPSHEWEDQTLHGSPQWQCKHCDVWRNHRDAAFPCPEAAGAAERQRAAREEAERQEYLRLKAQHDRWEELKAKYEPRPEEKPG